ncbi:MarR family transcriptional regulator [Aeromonas hydrophila]|uniref:MarR family transcriptional regulator n=1 Tax=Aeromonas hydrophila TaxID=644 RepID=UPI002B46B754|nr:helix-turn-helix domain-containing protein [Aeromonas hydrophila]
MAMSAIELAQRLDVSVPQIERALARLKEKGLIVDVSDEQHEGEDKKLDEHDR